VLVKVHSGCIGQANVSLRRAEPPAPKCRCKKKIDYAEANDLVAQGVAKWVVTKRERGVEEVRCHFCTSMSNVERKSCDNCHGTGKTSVARVWETFNNDIVRLGDDREGFKEVTPRVASIEEEHIEGAYVNKVAHVIERIKEYASMIQEALAWFGPFFRCKMGARLRDAKTGEVIEPGIPEPPDDWRTQTGRKWDQGLTVLRTIATEGLVEDTGYEETFTPDPPPYPDPMLSSGVVEGGDRFISLQNYSLSKIDEGDYVICDDRVIAAGISWSREDLQAGLNRRLRTA
jgi:hypothetical protein